MSATPLGAPGVLWRTCEEGGGTGTGPEGGGAGPGRGVRVGEACRQGPRWPDPTWSPSETQLGAHGTEGCGDGFWKLRQEKDKHWSRRAHPAPAAGPALPAPRGARCSFRVLRVALRSEATRPAAAAGTLSSRPGLGWLHGTAAGGSQDANRSESRLQTERQVLLWRVVGALGWRFVWLVGGPGEGSRQGGGESPPSVPGGPLAMPLGPEGQWAGSFSLRAESQVPHLSPGRMRWSVSLFTQHFMLRGGRRCVIYARRF